ncbi:MAG: hypothetical protein QF908_03780 [Dehalococcoidia bacterium]|nr:hypothetical protein [Dehalococcoidia bacterium]
MVRSNEVPVPATATPVPAPTPTPESPSGVTAAKLPSPDPTATSTPAPTAVPTPEPTAVKNVSSGGGGESAPTATPESAIEGPGDITTSDEIPVELNFDIILERLTNQNYTPEIDFGNGGGFIPVEIIEKEDGSVSVEITAQYSDVGEYEGQLRLVNVRGEVITLDNFVVNVVPTLTVTAPTVMSFSGIIKADMEKPLVEVDFYPFKAVSVVSSAGGRRSVCRS